MRILINSESLNPGLLTVKRENIVKTLGVPEEKADRYIIQLIDELMAESIDMCRPRAAVTVIDNPVFSKNDGTMSLGNVSFGLNRMVTSALLKSTSVAVFAGTCGEATGLYSARLLRDGHALEGFIVDLVGSEIAESVAEYIHNRVTTELAPEGIRTTNRYSPGYCNWPVSDQQKLFSLLGSNNCGIHLTESSLMLPIKSVSGVIGLGRGVINRGYACAWCDMNQCLYRDRK